jgi:starch synthase (maltosyl-transferring)
MFSRSQSGLPATVQGWNYSHIIIEDVTPAVEGGRYPVKRVVGEPCVVEADVFREGHQILRVVVQWRCERDEGFAEAPMISLGNDRWRGEFAPSENARYFYGIEAWTDIFASWLADFTKKARSGRDIGSDLLEGILYLEAIAKHANPADADFLSRCIANLKENQVHVVATVDTLSDPRIAEIAAHVADRAGVTRLDPFLELIVDRPKARFSSWYEMFPRSQSSAPDRQGTFREAESRLPGIRDLGFDVLYLPPIHPIGRTNRKGPGNSLNGGNRAVGSPWAIGNEAGGHTAIDPALGTIADFERFVATARRLGIETALDFAVQSSPDHPWVREHPEWFSHRPDGSIKYAENPPKEYQDIYPIDFDTPDRRGLLAELHRVIEFWIDRGVTIFRVDNPHTKPIAVWQWLIRTIQAAHPEIIFLAEAFTRPKVMRALAKAGFTQSYTYFTWRNSKAELIEYMTELSQSPMREYFRPNFFTNTPDILPPILQSGGRPSFKLRLVLAATLSPSYGIYSGFELCENQAVPGTEEYLNSEKYEVKVRDWNAPGNINEFIAQVNAIRVHNPALQELSNLRFLPIDNDQIVFYSKATTNMDNVLLVAVNLDPVNVQSGTGVVPPEAIGANAGQSFRVKDLITGEVYTWAEHNYVRLDPLIQPAHVLRVEELL